MISLIRFEIEGEPIPQSRPRVTRNGNVYTPKRCADYRKLVALCASVAMQEKSMFQKDVPIVATIDFYRKRKATSRADIDNLLKSILDSCNGIVFEDDAQVVEIHCRKLQSDNPHVEIEFRRKRK